jgi:hypothetical protein
MMVWVAHGAPRPVGLVKWRAVHSLAMSCRVIASTIRAPGPPQKRLRTHGWGQHLSALHNSYEI